MKKKGISNRIYSRDNEFSKLFIPTSRQNNSKTMVILFNSDGIALRNDKNQLLLHHGGHGGCSSEEVFVPLITIELTHNLHSELIKKFSKLK